MANWNEQVTVSVQTGSARTRVGSDMTALLYLTDDVGAGFTERVRTYESLAAVLADSDLSSSTAVEAAQAWFSQARFGRRFKVGRRDPGDADWGAAFQAVRAADADWLWLTCKERKAHDAVGLDGWADTLVDDVEADGSVLFIGQTSDSDITAGTAGNGFEICKNASYKNVAGIWHSVDTEYADVALAAMLAGVDPDLRMTTAAWQQLTGITVQDSQVTDSEKSTVTGYYGNLYLSSHGVGTLHEGTVFSGGYLDERITVLWAKWRVDQAITQALLDRAALGDKVPYTDDGIQYLAQKVLNVLKKGEIIGHFAPGQSVVNAPKAADVSESVKASRQLSMTASAVLAGAVGSVQMTVYVTV